MSRVKVTLSVVTMMPSWLRFHSQDIVVPFAATLRMPCPNDASLQAHTPVSSLRLSWCSEPAHERMQLHYVASR